MKNKTLIFTTLFLLLVIPAGFFFLKSQSKDAANSLSEERQIHLNEGLARAKDELIETYNRSKKKPLVEGDIFPVLNYPVLVGKKPNWSEPTVITLGRDSSNSVLRFYERIKDLDIQKVHIISAGRISDERLAKFPTGVIILDARENDILDADSEPISRAISKKLSDSLGVYKNLSAYLLNANRKILYAHLNRGGFDATMPPVVTTFVEKGPSFIQPNSYPQLPINEPPRINVLPNDIGNALKAELNKPVAIIFFSDKEACSLCKSWLLQADELIQKWKSEDVGIVLVEAGKDDFTIKRLPNGVLSLSDINKKAGDSLNEFTKSWGVVGMPTSFILQNGIVVGNIPYTEIEAYGVRHREMHFQAIDKIINTLNNK